MKNLTLLWLCLFLAVPSQAGIITVDDDGPADFSNIQAAINASIDGDIIVVNPGTYTGPGNQTITIDLWEDDPFFDEKLVIVNPTAARPADAIYGTAIQIAGGGTITFVVTNTSGTISGNAGTNETVTIASVVVDRAKFQDMMWGAFTRRVYGTDYEIIKKAAVFASHHGLFSPDTPATIEAYDAGRDLIDGIAIATVMENHGYKMQEPGSLAQKLWPSDDPYVDGIIRNDYIDMSTTQLIGVLIQARKEEIIETIQKIWGWF